MPAPIRWRTSSYTSQNGSCVEVGPTVAAIHLRDTKQRTGGTVTLTAASWRGLLGSLRP